MFFSSFFQEFLLPLRLVGEIGTFRPPRHPRLEKEKIIYKMTHKWNYQPITPEQAEASRQLAQELGISPILGQLLIERGITTAAAARKFFRPQLPDLHDPFLMKDMDVAVARLNKAMGKKERILIYGDYELLHPRPLQRRLRGVLQRSGLRRGNRRETHHRIGLRHQSRRGDYVCPGERHRLHYL